MQVGLDVQAGLVHAVAVDGRRVVARASVPATRRPTQLVTKALRQLLAADPGVAQASSVTICRSVNEESLVQPDRLAPVTTIRISPHEEAPLPPMAGWPDDLVATIGIDHHQVLGGHRYDGSPAAQLDEARLHQIGAQLATRPAGQVAIVAAWSPVNAELEQQAAAIIAGHVPGVRIATSHELGGLGLIPRENATILNAALLPSAAVVTGDLTEQVEAALPRALIHFALSNGTVTETAHVVNYPIQTLWSGWACMLTGSSVLADSPDCVALEVQDDALRVGFTDGGLPRVTNHDVRVAGIRVNLWHPHVIEREPDLASLPQVLLDADRGRRRTAVAVGSRATNVPDTIRAHAPEHAEFARAVGAACSPVGAEVVRLVGGTDEQHQRARRASHDAALQQAILAGARPSTVRVFSSEEVPLAYLPGDIVQIRTRAVGRVDP